MVTNNSTNNSFPGLVRGGTVAPSAGYIGEQIRSAVAVGAAVPLVNATPATITSIALTAGVWDISAIGVVNGTLTGTQSIVSISPTTNTLSTAGGDDFVVSPTVSLVGSDYAQCVPSLRVVLAAPATYFLVMQVAFTVGAGSGYGRISATRVG